MKIFAFALRLGPAALDSDASTDRALTVYDLQPLGAVRQHDGGAGVRAGGGRRPLHVRVPVASLRGM